MLSVRRATQSDLQEWNEFVYSSPIGTIFHSREWIDIHRRNFGSTIIDLVAREEGKLIGTFSFRCGYYLHPRLQAIPSTVWYKEIASPVGEIENPYGGPVCPLDRPDVFKLLLSEAFRFAMPLGRGQVVLSPHIGHNKKICTCVLETGSQIYWRETLLLDLKESFERIESRFTPAVRRSVKKSQRLGVKIIEANEEFSIRSYHKILEETYARSGFLPYQSQFYEDLHQTFNKSNQIKLLFATYDNTPIATWAYLMDRNTVFYWTGGFLRNYASLNGSTLILRHMLELAKTNGYDTFDFTDISRKHPGIARFKASFGGELCEFPALKWHSPVLPALNYLIVRHSERVLGIARKRAHLTYFSQAVNNVA